MTYSDGILLWTILNSPYTIWAFASTLKFIETLF